MNKQFFHLVMILILCIFIQGYAFSNSTINDNSENQITKLLKQTISVLTSNQKLVAHNMEMFIEMNQNNKFSKDQYCLYRYLEGYEQGFVGKFEQAKSTLRELVESCEKLHIKIRSAATLANLQIISQEYEKAINTLNFSINNVNKVDDADLRHKVYTVATVVYRLANQYEQSLKFAELLINDSPVGSYVCKGLVAKYRALLRMNPSIIDLDKGVNEALASCAETGDFVIGGFLELEWLELQLSKTEINGYKFNILLKHLKTIEKKIEKAKYQNLIGVKNALMANTYWKSGQIEKAKDYALKAIETSKALGATKQENTALSILVNYSKQKKNFEKSLNYAEQQLQAEKKLFDNNLTKAMAYQSIMHNNFANRQEIELLQQQNKVLALEKNLSKKSAQVQKLVILLLIAVTGFFVLWGLWQRRSQRIYKELSERDHMTSIFNRNGLRKYTESLLEYSQENDTQVGCAVFDLDWFKKINDQFGHATGDWTIKNVIKKCESLGNNKATFGRLGGEEFAIILSDTNKEEMYVFCENCRNAINSLLTKNSGHQFKISASFGMTTSNESGLSYSDMLIHADDALYKAKKNGRNNTVIYHQET